MIRTLIFGFFFFFVFLFVILGMGIMRLLSIGKKPQANRNSRDPRFHFTMNRGGGVRNPFEPSNPRDPRDPRMHNANKDPRFRAAHGGTARQNASDVRDFLGSQARSEKDISNRAKILNTSRLSQKDSQETEEKHR